MFDIGWSELMLIGIVALIVIGPKELPSVLRTVGRTVTKLRRMAGEFQGQFQEALREADIADMRKEITDITDTARSSMTSVGAGEAFDPLKSIREEIRATVEGAAPPKAAAETATGAPGPAPTAPEAPVEALIPPPSDEPLPPPVFPVESSPVPAPSPAQTPAPSTSQQ
ncbi:MULTISPECIES: Sec-independent protein translocase protein TatB [unclassified Xanthobacter]|uniref:Sec-independent protein translocase protein TatB n=1 Tax=unclassified Xanthobacter TaxID=2623496 RepID=UPI001F36470F|nr:MULTISPECIES: Sec-independent protein translocase protein TatB [unclassified Xanthobacter]